MFADRIDAGRQLALALARYRGTRPVVLGIPRGGVPVAAEVARALAGDLDIVLVRKLHAPWSQEVAIGAVDETGWTWLARGAAASGADAQEIERQVHEQRDELARRRACYAPGRPLPVLQGRVAIVVDDGLATGATMVAALHAVRGRGPRTLVCAVPVASAGARALVLPLADEVVALSVPPDFRAVGAYYMDFPQLADEAVVALLSPAAG
ncbi:MULTISPECIES: phosphoribosyltransferase family protein [Ramlibacter]|uniref:Phosphoribosyltransferase n=1 Tax=Ramlibacter aquaticus TaxID=2780094 RepID=A0ABR9SF32_9BURK|nr:MULTISPECIES: phosphoribosyltransferase family protein [Ramlibacter]MBE7940906.1 phosphoribosyltransferase [Ramlibacter aquaticus]